MADVSHLYPPTPAGVPADLTTPTGSYRFRVVIVLVCLILFVGVYLGLTVGSAYTCYACFAELGADEPTTATKTTYDRRTGKYVTTPRSSKPVF
jgi:hypothetical protein